MLKHFSSGGAIALMSLFVALLTACGGGGGGNSGPVVAPNAVPVARTGPNLTTTVGSLVSLDGSTSSDADGDLLTYSWVLSSPTGSESRLNNPTNVRPTFTPDKEGTYVLTLTVSDGKSSSAIATQSVQAAPIAAAIAIDQAEPVTGNVKLSLPVKLPVKWFVDATEIGDGIAGELNTLTWNADLVTSGQHVLVARVKTGPTTYQEIRRTVQVATSNITIRVVSYSAGNVDIDASSPFGIASVSGSIKGVTITASKAAETVYRIAIDRKAVGSGTHLMLITIVDGAGAKKQLEQTIQIDNAPELQLVSPAANAFVYGNMRIAGSASSDKAGPIQITVKLGDLIIASGAASSIDTSYSLASMTPGQYTVTLTATDSAGTSSSTSRTIVVTSSAALAYTPAFSLPGTGEEYSLEAIDGTRAVYIYGSTARVHNFAAGSDSALALPAGATRSAMTSWALDGGRIYASGKGADCVPYDSCVYQWAADGTLTNLSLLNQALNGSAGESSPVAHDGYVLTRIEPSNRGFSLYNASTGARTAIALLSTTSLASLQQFAVVNSAVHVVYWVADGTPSQFRPAHWTSSPQSTELLSPTDDNTRSGVPQTDGVRVVWRRYDTGQRDPARFAPNRLYSKPLSGGSPTLITDSMLSFIANDGMLAWVEGSYNSDGFGKLKASTATTTSDLFPNAKLLAANGSYVLYSAQGKLYAWRTSTGKSTLIADVNPGTALLSGNSVVFVFGTDVYRVALN